MAAPCSGEMLQGKLRKSAPGSPGGKQWQGGGRTCGVLWASLSLHSVVQLGAGLPEAPRSHRQSPDLGPQEVRAGGGSGG